jgi:hypothetical protein
MPGDSSEADNGRPEAPGPTADRRSPPVSRLRPLWLALGLYLALTVVYFASASPERIWHHTPYNHFAHQARSWLDGRLELGYPPPLYAQGNDFARFEGRWYVVFPSFPAVLLLPAVALAERVEQVRDGQVFLWLAGAGPAFFFLALERLRELGRSAHGERTHLALAALLGLGTVYWFCAEQGTVWFAAHVVGVALAALYLRWSLGGAHPLLAGLALGLGYWTRASLLFAAPLFVIEAAVAASRRGTPRQSLLDFLRRLLLFALPIGALLTLSLWHNHARFHDPFEVGYRYLTVAWQARIERWGLFSYHYLARNLGVLLTSLPFRNQGAGAPLQISIHGLALWVTTPVYLLLLWPRKKGATWWALAATALCVGLPSLLYQNTGQVQFGYRFSNDYAVFLLAMLAVSRPRFGLFFWGLGLWGVAINAFGALTFDRARAARFYAEDRSHAVYQPD